MADWKDTIQILFSFGGKENKEYTLLHYIKCNRDEWNVAHLYDPETKSWSAGNYRYSLESALTCCLEKMTSTAVKSDYQLDVEEKYVISFNRLTELATQFKDGLIEDDEESALEYFDEICEMTELEKEFFGIEEEEE